MSDQLSFSAVLLIGVPAGHSVNFVQPSDLTVPRVVPITFCSLKVVAVLFIEANRTTADNESYFKNLFKIYSCLPGV